MANLIPEDKALDEKQTNYYDLCFFLYCFYCSYIVRIKPELPKEGSKKLNLVIWAYLTFYT